MSGINIWAPPLRPMYGKPLNRVRGETWGPKIDQPSRRHYPERVTDSVVALSDCDKVWNDQAYSVCSGLNNKHSEGSQSADGILMMVTRFSFFTTTKYTNCDLWLSGSGVTQSNSARTWSLLASPPSLAELRRGLRRIFTIRWYCQQR